MGVSKNGIKIYNNSKRQNLVAADSRHHSSKKTESFLKKNNIQNIIRLGSSLKLCYLAEGKIDVYPRFEGTKEWDTAAGDIICKEAGCRIIDMVTREEMSYNKNSIKNNHFIAYRKDLELIL